MKTLKFLTYTVFVLFLSMSITSCKGDDGTEGPAGADGTNGTDGQDGNANVQTYTFDVSAESGTLFLLELAAITNDVLENDAILHYLDGGTDWYPVPGTGKLGSHIVRVFDLIENAGFKFVDFNGTPVSITAGTYVTAKVIIIESSNTTAGRGVNTLTPKERIQNELENAGVDINNYYAVCEYYGINPE